YRTALVQGIVAVAALGGLDAGRAPGVAFAGRDGLPGGRQPGAGGVEGPLGEAGAARVTVVDEDGGQQRVRVERHRDTADVPAVARREQRQHADRGVLRRVQGAAEDLRVDPGPVQLVLGDRPPHGAGAQRAGGRSSFVSPRTSPVMTRRRRKETTWLVTSTEPKQRRPSPHGISVSVSRTEIDVVSRATV